MKNTMIALVLSVFVLGCGGDKKYGTKCTMDSDCKTGVGCYCEAGERDEAGECPNNTGTCLSPSDIAAKSKAGDKADDKAGK